MIAKTRKTISVLSTLLCFCLLSTQVAGQVGEGSATEKPTGGTYTGPGDTVGTGGIGSGQPGTTGPAVLPWGGTSTGPGSIYPDGAAPPGYPGDLTDGEGTTSPESRPGVNNPDSWEVWWYYNRWAHLETDPLSKLLATTGMQGFFLGRGEKQQDPGVPRPTMSQLREVVFPALAKVLAEGGSSELTIHALHALAKLHVNDSRDVDDDFRSIVTKALRSGNQEITEKAVLALGIQGERRFVTWLAAILRDDSLAHELLKRDLVGPTIRAFAAYALGLMAERNESPQLRRRIQVELGLALSERRPEVQAAALLATGLNALPIEEDIVDDGSSVGTRVDQVMRVLEFFEDEQHDLVARSQAPNALARLMVGAPESLRTRVAHALLVAIGTHSSEPREVQQGAVLALGSVGRGGTEPIDQEIRKELERVAYRSSIHRLTRYMAMIALAEVASRPGDGEEPYDGLPAVRKLLRKQLLRNRGQALCWTAIALGILEEDAAERGDAPDADVAAALRTQFKGSRSPETAGALALALGLLNDQEAPRLLLKRMRETGHARVRGYTALALGMIGDKDATEPLRALLEDSLNHPFTLHQVAIGLALLGDRHTGPRLLDLFVEASNPRSRASMAAAMSWARDPGSLPRLCSLVTDPRYGDSTRAWTAVAIGRIADEDPWPWVGRLSVGVQYDVALPTLIEPRFLSGLLDLP